MGKVGLVFEKGILQMEKDIQFSAKKVDDSWKDKVAVDKGAAPAAQGPASQREGNRPPPVSSEAFLQFLNSLALQALVHLGEVPHPETRQPEPNLEQAREVIDLLLALKAKTEGNVGPEEKSFFNSVLPEIQMKFVRSAP